LILVCTDFLTMQGRYLSWGQTRLLDDYDIVYLYLKTKTT
jgi:hypothetical protein